MFTEKLIVVTGKGGVGKTLLASALAQLSARHCSTILVTLHPHDSRHNVFGAELRYTPTPVSEGLQICRLDSLEAVREYVRRKLPFAGMYDPFLRSRMFRDFAEAAPGFQELMSLGKLYDLATESGFDRVILDAPATGHLKTLLDVPAATLAAVHVGPLNHNARKIQDLLLDPERTRVVLATLPEEMAVAELLDLNGYCRTQRMNAGPVLLNQVVPQRFAAEEIASLGAGGLDVAPDATSAALGWAARSALAESGLARVQAAAVAPLESMAVVRVPRFSGHDAGTLVDRITQTLAVELASYG
jgi:anion-transporting  ArsA/GET3 family ATPase